MTLFAILIHIKQIFMPSVIFKVFICENRKLALCLKHLHKNLKWTTLPRSQMINVFRHASDTDVYPVYSSMKTITWIHFSFAEYIFIVTKCSHSKTVNLLDMILNVTPVSIQGASIIASKTIEKSTSDVQRLMHRKTCFIPTLAFYGSHFTYTGCDGVMFPNSMLLTP